MALRAFQNILSFRALGGSISCSNTAMNQMWLKLWPLDGCLKLQRTSFFNLSSMSLIANNYFAGVIQDWAQLLNRRNFASFCFVNRVENKATDCLARLIFYRTWYILDWWHSSPIAQCCSWWCTTFEPSFWLIIHHP